MEGSRESMADSAGRASRRPSAYYHLGGMEESAQVPRYKDGFGVCRHDQNLGKGWARGGEMDAEGFEKNGYSSD